MTAMVTGFGVVIDEKNLQKPGRSPDGQHTKQSSGPYISASIQRQPAPLVPPYRPADYHYAFICYRFP